MQDKTILTRGLISRENLRYFSAFLCCWPPVV